MSKCHIFHWGARYRGLKYIAYVSLLPSYLPRISVTGPFFIREDTLGFSGVAHTRGRPLTTQGSGHMEHCLCHRCGMDLQLLGCWALPTLFFVFLKYSALGLWQVSLPLAVPFSFLWIPFFVQFISREVFPHSSAGKESAYHAGDPGQFLSWEDPREEGKATHSSILAWRIPWTV